MDNCGDANSAQMWASMAKCAARLWRPAGVRLTVWRVLPLRGHCASMILMCDLQIWDIDMTGRETPGPSRRSAPDRSRAHRLSLRVVRSSIRMVVEPRVVFDIPTTEDRNASPSRIDAEADR